MFFAQLHSKNPSAGTRQSASPATSPLPTVNLAFLQSTNRDFTHCHFQNASGTPPSTTSCGFISHFALRPPNIPFTPLPAVRMDHHRHFFFRADRDCGIPVFHSTSFPGKRHSTRPQTARLESVRTLSENPRPCIEPPLSLRRIHAHGPAPSQLEIL